MYGVWGVQGSGKSTLVFQIIKAFCKKGLKVCFVDVEKAFNKKQQIAFGLREYVENGAIIYLTVDNYVQLDEVVTAVGKDPEVKLLVVDSETQLLPKLLDDVSVADNQPGQKARQASVLLTKMKSRFYEAGIASIILFHARANISMTANIYAPAEKQAGGFAGRHIPDVILQVKAGQKIKDGDGILGQVVHLVCDKNKFVPPYRQISRNLLFGRGIVKKNEIIDLAIERGLITQSGSFFKLPGGETIRGTAALYEMSNDMVRDLQSKL